jgi:hypothetical protein
MGGRNARGEEANKMIAGMTALGRVGLNELTSA